jgi:hypothetical protein
MAVSLTLFLIIGARRDRRKALERTFEFSGDAE